MKGASKTKKRNASSKSAFKKSKRARFSLVGREPTGPELKVVDVNNAGSSPNINIVSTTATITLLNGMDLGAGAFQRIGRSVHWKSLHVRGALYLNNGSGSFGSTAGECARIMVVYDRQPNGAAVSIIEILQTIDANGNGSSSPFDYPNLTNSDRFIVLADQQVNVPYTSTGSGAGTLAASSAQVLASLPAKDFDRYIDISGLPTNYKGDTEAVASVATGSLYLVTLGSLAVASAGLTFNWTARLRYTDA